MAVLSGYGMHEMTWETCDDMLGCGLVASAADAQGRGVSITVKQNGIVADLTGTSGSAMDPRLCEKDCLLWIEHVGCDGTTCPIAAE